MEPTENAKKPDKLRFWLALMLEDLPVGTQFQPGRLHLTIIPWFVSELDEDALINSFSGKFSKINKFNLVLGQKAMFGPKKDVSVSLIEPNQTLQALHELSLEWFDEIGARWAVKNAHVAQDYKPHIRRRQGTKIKTGEIYKINSLSLIKAARHEDGKRVVAARISLK
ncbi:TPA: hypothetical protein DIS56_00840 [Candidatus Saccharibacteria bacterium]|nr:MAG: hypothetical protein UX30_C0003G0112 [Candidatus Saccharibacteria bacterium GW2011_GWA2_46_10]OGL36296.1 MAG: hypothetical protein A3F05_03220 [Candidatus Saccharibacteria bacterium RIFCSPHIGHO2_12_FULL_47_17]HCM51669.1 hypothetical protein [Candidatus Saccharibacteria bacterium]